MSPLLSKITKEKKPCYLAEDLNMNVLQVESNADIENYFDELTDKHFTPLSHILEPPPMMHDDYHPSSEQEAICLQESRGD